MQTRILSTTFTLILFAAVINASAQPSENESDQLVIVWTGDDPYQAERMVLMYAHTAKTEEWFKEVTLIIWGPSAKLTAENLKIQEKLKDMQKDDVEIKACIACANMYGIANDLKALGFEVKGMGKPLTDFLKSDAKVLTF